MTDRPLVSVILPTHDRAHLIDRAIRSALSQTYSNFEIIVIDDASRDNTESVVRSFSDPRIRYLRLEERKGCSAARNAGMDVALGSHVAILDSDDEWLPQKLERQLETLASSGDNVGIVVCGMDLAKRNRDYLMPDTSGDVYRLVLERRYDVRSSTFLLSPLAIRAGIRFDEQLPASTDWDLLVRVTRDFHLALTPEVLAVQHFDSKPRMWSGGNIIAAGEILLEKYRHEMSGFPRARVAIHRRIVKAAVSLGDYGSARRHLRGALRASPWSPGLHARLAVLLVSPRLYRRVFGRVGP